MSDYSHWDHSRDTFLYDALGGVEPFNALQQSLRAQWMKARGVDFPPRYRNDYWLSHTDRFWCEAKGIKPVDNEATHRQVNGLTPTIPHFAAFARGERIVVITAQPYFSTPADLAKWEREWSEVAERHGLTFEMTTHHSWWFLGRTVLLSLWLPGEADRA